MTAMTSLRLSLLALAPLVSFAATPAIPMEVPPMLSASSLLDPATVAGPSHRVREQVPTDGYMAYFTIDSDYGVFECVGQFQAKQRVAEIAAIRELVEVSRSEMFAEGLKQSVKQPVEAVKNIVHDPVGAVKGVPGTVGHFFKKVGNSVSGAARTLRDHNPKAVKGDAASGQELANAGKGVIGFDKARLGCAKQLGVDPYSDNARLQEEIDKVSWVFFSGGLPLRLGAMLASGGASTALSATKAVGLPDEIYLLTPTELSLRDQEALEAMKVDPEVIRTFKTNPALSITLRRSMLRSLEAIGPMKGSPQVIALAASCENRRQADFLNQALELLATRHIEGREKITDIEVHGRLLGAIGAGGRLVVPAPLDHLSWTPEVAEFASRDDLVGRNPALLHTGTLSASAQRGLQSSGWSMERH